MIAIVKTKQGVGQVELLERSIPKPKNNEVRIKIIVAGICGTDIKIYKGEASSNPPVILGHEYAGIIDKVGHDVKKFKVGDHVVSETAQVICGKCRYCRSGTPLMCKERLSIGYGVDGAFAEYIVVREDLIHTIPESLSFQEAALCEPFAVALHGVWDQVNLSPEDEVLVLGPGCIGQFAAQAAKVKGAKVTLVGTPKDEVRLSIAEKMGIETMILYEGQATEASFLKREFDAVVDCSGSEGAISLGLHCLRPEGTFVQIGLTKPRIAINYSLVSQKELRIQGSFGHRWHNWEKAIELLGSKKVDGTAFISNCYRLKDWSQAFQDVEEQKGIKVLLKP